MTKRGAQRARGRRKAWRRGLAQITQTGSLGWRNVEVARDENGAVVMLSNGRPVAWMSVEAFNELVSG